MLSPLLRVAHPLRQFLVLRSDRCPAHGGSAPAIIVGRHVDAAVDEELHGFVIFVPDQLMQDARGLMRAPVRVDIDAVREEKAGDLEVVVEDNTGQSQLVGSWTARGGKQFFKITQRAEPARRPFGHRD